MPPSTRDKKDKNDNECAEPCEIHPEELIKYFCQTHQILNCGHCVVQSHRSCHVDIISDISNTFKDDPKYKDIDKAIAKLFKDISDCASDVKKNMKLIEEMSEGEVSKLRKCRDEVNHYFDEREKSLLKIIEQMKNRDEAMLDNLVSKCDDLKAKVVEIKNNLEAQENKPIKLFIEAKQAEKNLEVTEATLSGINKQNSIHQYRFRKDLATESLMASKTGLGIVKEEVVDALKAQGDCFEKSLEEKSAGYTMATGQNTIIHAEMDELPLDVTNGSRRRYLSENSDDSGNDRLPSYYTSDVHVSDIETSRRQGRSRNLYSSYDSTVDPREMKHGHWTKELRNRFNNLETSLNCEDIGGGHAQKAEIYFRGLHKPGSKQQQVKMESKDSKLIKKTGRKTPKYCCICKGIYRGKVIDGRKVSLHRFPQNKRLKRVWVQRCKTVMRSFQWNEHRRLCSEHFVGFRGPSFQHTLPSMFPTETGATKTFQPTLLDEDVGDDDDGDTVNDDLDLELSNDDSIQPQLSFVSPSGHAIDTSVHLHDYCMGPVLQPQNQSFRCCDTQTENNCAVMEVQTEESFLGKTADFSSQTEHSTRDFGVQCQLPMLTYDDVKYNDDLVSFYTGIPNRVVFEALFDEIKDEAEVRTSRRKLNYKDSDGGRPRTLSVLDEFFMVLMRLRLVTRNSQKNVDSWTCLKKETP
ncbi:uncharacterized protein LOC128215337 [Mya arenaria]|uniref:uncharacterized protein LOC128215337 n=3 Tax=Mya arenaria TaxID=6604 RepID=UPI0022E252E8|nr:uncharacterized protein LOC128215337 [Mya arenaria]